MSRMFSRHEVLVETGTGDRVTDSLGLTHTLHQQFVPVPATVQWNNVGESGGVVPEPSTSVTVLAKNWPGFPNGRFRWAGNEFEQVGPAKTFNGSPATAHVEVSGRWLGVL